MLCIQEGHLRMHRPKSRIASNGALLTGNISPFVIFGGDDTFHRVVHTEGRQKNIWGYMMADNIWYQKEEAKPAKAGRCLFCLWIIKKASVAKTKLRR